MTAAETRLPAEPIEPWISLAWQLAVTTGMAVAAMVTAFVVIVVLIETYDEWIGAPRPPAFWRRPWCWVFGHDRGGQACRRCGETSAEAAR